MRKNAQEFNLFRPVGPTQNTRTQSAPTLSSTDKTSGDENTRPATCPPVTVQEKDMMFPISLNVDKKMAHDLSFMIHKALFSTVLANISGKKPALFSKEEENRSADLGITDARKKQLLKSVSDSALKQVQGWGVWAAQEENRGRNAPTDGTDDAGLSIELTGQTG